MIGDYKIVYTVSDIANLVPDALRSIKSLMKFVAKENVIVLHTPPRTMKSILELSKVANVQYADNITKPFAIMPEKGLRHYGEKVQLCNINSENVIFLDADTLIRKDVTLLLDGDFDFAAMPVKSDETMEDRIRLFSKINSHALPQYNCGLLVFKNYFHRKIGDLWLKYINDESLREPVFNTWEQWALSLALSMSNAKIKNLTFYHHARMWAGKSHVDAFIMHGIPTHAHMRFRAWLGRERRRLEKRVIP